MQSQTPPASSPVKAVVLLPCPFCGSEADYFSDPHDHGTVHSVDCREGYCRIICGRKEVVIENWNKRLKAKTMTDMAVEHCDALAELTQQIGELNFRINDLDCRNAALETLAADAIDAIEEWAVYVSEYFKEKHRLREQMAEFRQRLKTEVSKRVLT